MKNEFYKQFKNKFFVFFLLLALVYTFTVAFIYMKAEKPDTPAYNLSNIEKYKSIDEIPELLAEQEAGLAELERQWQAGEITIRDFYIQEKVSYEEKIKMYNFLYDNNLAYNSVAEYNSLAFTTDRVAFMDFFLTACLVASLVLFTIFSITIVNNEFSSGAYKFVYSGKNRLKVLKNKALTYFIICNSFFVFYTLLSFIFGSIYSSNYDYLIVSGEAIRPYSVASYTALYILCLYLSVLFWQIFIFALALCIKNIYVLLITCGGLIWSLKWGIVKLNVPYLTAFTLSPFQTSDVAISPWMFALNTVMKFILLAGFCVFAVYNFKKKDLA